MKTARVVLALCITCIALGGCTKTAKTDVTTDNPKNAVTTSIDIANYTPTFNRAAPQLGIFGTVYVSQSGYAPAFAALAGVDAQSRLAALRNPALADETYTFLQEYGAVLQVNVPDTLNRSDNRPQALNDYVEGLTNITERAKRRTADLKTAIDRITEMRKAAQDEVNTHQKAVKNAEKLNDYQTIGAEQKLLGEAQTRLTQIESELRTTNDVEKTFEKLTAIGDKRLAAIEQNREVLIAGLKVVDLPGIEDLKILESGNSRSSSDDGGFSLGL